MPKNLFLAALAAAVVVGIGYADQSTKTIVVPAGKTSADSGKQMYMSYCATCHGVDGKGNGPVAPALKKQPDRFDRIEQKQRWKVSVAAR